MNEEKLKPLIALILLLSGHPFVLFILVVLDVFEVSI